MTSSFPIPTATEITTHLNNKIPLGLQNGSDTNGLEHASISSMWAHESKRTTWYTKANEYWQAEENCPSTDDGVLGGYGNISPVDVLGSLDFLIHLVRLTSSTSLPFIINDTKIAVDCGAGIGRVTRELLLKNGFGHVDVIEQSSRLLASAPEYISELKTVENPTAKCSFLCLGLQDYNPGANSVDLIWIQWVIGHLNDVDCVSFFMRCLSSLTLSGFIVIKDNTCGNEMFHVDKTDSSVTRSEVYLMQLVELAGGVVVKKTVQSDFPDDLFPVPMFAIRRKKR